MLEKLWLVRSFTPSALITTLSFFGDVFGVEFTKEDRKDMFFDFSAGEEVVAVFSDEDQAIDCVLHNWNDFHEQNNDYVCIYALDQVPYAYSSAESEIWFAWINGEYVPIDNINHDMLVFGW